MDTKTTTTTIITNQPGATGTLVPENVREWSTSVFDCCVDVKSCICGYFCMPCTLCRLSSRLGDCALMPFCAPGGLVAMRTKVRILGGIRGTICMDCVYMQVCGPCTICQLEREMDRMNIV